MKLPRLKVGVVVVTVVPAVVVVVVVVRDVAWNKNAENIFQNNVIEENN